MLPTENMLREKNSLKNPAVENDAWGKSMEIGTTLVIILTVGFMLLAVTDWFPWTISMSSMLAWIGNRV